jgi:hypothetical protein
MIINNSNGTNVASITLVRKLILITTKHATFYKFKWWNEYEEVRVTKQILISFLLGRYEDEVLCDVISMHVAHFLLGRP